MTMETLCRICMSSSGHLVKLFKVPHDADAEPCLAEMLNECVGCEVKPEDPLPKQICVTCSLDTQNAFKFKRRCEQSYKQFWEVLNEEKAVRELFVADDWTIPVRPIGANKTVMNDKKHSGCKRSKLKDLLQPAEDEVSIACVKQEKPDSDAEESSEVNPLQPTEGSIDISCVKKEKLNDSEEEDIEQILPDSPHRQHSCTEKFHVSSPRNVPRLNQEQPRTSSKSSVGVFISINTMQGKSISNKTFPAKDMQLHKAHGCLFKCPRCPKTSVNRVDIELHMHVHTAQRRYKCTHCPKAFHRRSELQTHLNVHSGERPYLCPHCSQAFNHPSNLYRHIRTHVDKPPYKCPLCPKTFLKKETAEQHKATHTYKCPHCNSGFRKHSCRPVQERGKFTYINSKDLH